MDEAAGIIMGEEWMKDAAWLVEFPLSPETVVHRPKAQLSSEAGIIGFAEDKDLRARHYEADLEFHERFHCRFKCEG